jgi:hypothetical protein
MEGFYDKSQEWLQVPEWASGRTYYARELVLYSGTVWRCVTPNSDIVFTPSNWASASAGAVQKAYVTTMTAGVATYTLPELPAPDSAVQCFINGVDVNYTLVGVNLTITEYQAGEIEADDELKVMYFA